MLDEICFSFNYRGVYRNEWEIKCGYKKKYDFYIVFDLFKVYVLYNKNV